MSHEQARIVFICYQQEVGSVLWLILKHRKSKTKLNQIRFCVLWPSKQSTGKADPRGMGSEAEKA